MAPKTRPGAGWQQGWRLQSCRHQGAWEKHGKNSPSCDWVGVKALRVVLCWTKKPHAWYMTWEPCLRVQYKTRQQHVWLFFLTLLRCHGFHPVRSGPPFPSPSWLPQFIRLCELSAGNILGETTIFQFHTIPRNHKSCSPCPFLPMGMLVGMKASGFSYRSPWIGSWYHPEDCPSVHQGGRRRCLVVGGLGRRDDGHAPGGWLWKDPWQFLSWCIYDCWRFYLGHVCIDIHIIIYIYILYIIILYNIYIYIIYIIYIYIYILYFFIYLLHTAHLHIHILIYIYTYDNQYLYVTKYWSLFYLGILLVISLSLSLYIYIS